MIGKGRRQGNLYFLNLELFFSCHRNANICDASYVVSSVNQICGMLGLAIYLMLGCNILIILYIFQIQNYNLCLIAKLVT